MAQQYGLLQIVLGAGVILLAFLYRVRADYTKFR